MICIISSIATAETLLEPFAETVHSLSLSWKWKFGGSDLWDWNAWLSRSWATGVGATDMTASKKAERSLEDDDLIGERECGMEISTGVTGHRVHM